MPQLYTPFLGDVTAKMGGALLGAQQQRQTRSLSESAYMGDPQAMAQLAAVNPQAAAQIQQMTRQREQDRLSAASREKEMSIEAKQIIGQTIQEAAKFSTIEEAQSYIDTQIVANEGIMDTSKFQALTPETFSQIKTQFGARPEKVTTKVVDGKLVDDQTGKVIFESTADINQGNVKELLAGSSEGALTAGEAAFRAAGGGKDGVNAALKAAEKVDKREARASEKELAYTEILDSAKDFEKMINDPSFSGAVGAIDDITAGIGAQFGSKEGLLNKKAKRASSRLVLKLASSLKGSMSDRDLELLKDGAPSSTDSPDVWKDWYQNEYLPLAIRGAKKEGRDTSELEAMMATTGDEGVLVSSQAEYDSLPKGAIYVEDGKRYRK